MPNFKGEAFESENQIGWVMARGILFLKKKTGRSDGP